MKFGKKHIWALSLLFLVNCDSLLSTKSDVNIEPADFKIENISEVERYKVVNLHGNYGNVSTDILLDSATGKTWSMVWVKDADHGNYLAWQPLTKYIYSIPDIVNREQNGRLLKLAVQNFSKNFGDKSLEIETEITIKMIGDKKLNLKKDELLNQQNLFFEDFENFIQENFDEPKKLEWGNKEVADKKK